MLGERAPYAHAFIAVCGTTVLETWPSGTRWADLSEYEDEPITYGIPHLGEEGRLRVAEAAQGMDGTRYRTRDYLWHALWRAGWQTRRMGARAADPGFLLPAQMVAAAYERAGFPLFPGRPCWDVTLLDLAGLFFAGDGWDISVPMASRR